MAEKCFAKSAKDVIPRYYTVIGPRYNLTSSSLLLPRSAWKNEVVERQVRSLSTKGRCGRLIIPQLRFQVRPSPAYASSFSRPLGISHIIDFVLYITLYISYVTFVSWKSSLNEEIVWNVDCFIKHVELFNVYSHSNTWNNSQIGKVVFYFKNLGNLRSLSNQKIPSLWPQMNSLINHVEWFNVHSRWNVWIIRKRYKYYILTWELDKIWN